MINLHNHSYYSLNETFVSIDDIIKYTKDHNLDTFCITDSDSVTSFAKALRKARLNNLKMIPGIDLYIRPNKSYDKTLIAGQYRILSRIVNKQSVNEDDVNVLNQVDPLFHIKVGKTTEEQRNKISKIKDKVEMKYKSKIPVTEDQWTDADHPLVYDHFTETFLAKNKNGLSHIFMMFSYHDKKGTHHMPYLKDIEYLSKKQENGKRINDWGNEVNTYKDVTINCFNDLMLLTGQHGTYLNALLLDNKIDEAEEYLDKLSDKIDVYLVLEVHGRPEEQDIHNKLISLYEKFKDKVHLVAANNTFCQSKDQENELRLYQAVNNNTDTSSDSYHSEYNYMMDDDQMNKLLLDSGISEKYVDLGINTANDIPNKVEFMDFPQGRMLRDRNAELRAACEEGLERIYGGTDMYETAKKRMNYELQTIKDMEFSEYFIKVKQITDTAYALGSLVGPARGSAGGSIVCYLTGIIAIDPLKYGLFFERFLNKGRGTVPMKDKDGNLMKDYSGNQMYKYSFPDIDLDLSSEYRLKPDNTADFNIHRKRKSFH